VNPALRALLPAAVHSALRGTPTRCCACTCLRGGLIPTLPRERNPAERSDQVDEALFTTHDLRGDAIPVGPRGAGRHPPGRSPRLSRRAVRARLLPVRPGYRLRGQPARSVRRVARRLAATAGRSHAAGPPHADPLGRAGPAHADLQRAAGGRRDPRRPARGRALHRAFGARQRPQRMRLPRCRALLRRASGVPLWTLAQPLRADPADPQAARARAPPARPLGETR
jgi:hypothetical protein